MLKSHFDISKGDDVEEIIEEQTKEENGEDVLEEEKKVYLIRKLSKSDISVRLSLLGKTADGDGYTYLKATCTGMSLTDIGAIKSFKHLQFVDVSNNFLDLDSLQPVTELPYLVLIHADKNLLNSVALKKTKYLQVMIMNNNNLKSVHDLFQPQLSTLEVGYNKINKVYFVNRMPTLKCLDFRYNLIQDISDFDFPNLDSLYLAGNKIKSLVGLEKLTNLRILHVRYNPIRLLDGFDEGHTKLQYINLRNCKVLTALETLVLKGCPYMGGTGEEEAGTEEEPADLRVEVLAALPRLKRINKSVVSPEERTEAKDLMMQWLEEGENDEEEIVEEEMHAEGSRNEE
ncbi:putative axonemal leucine-rich repeat protein [Operophtera brumata]|uniref:Putative axonemal leucine-rich repeat protein n=1 Tax=Operophtera brumata TaxID=104452 RepID=A0A0L7L3G8_OPEBR|nr:putative axonemal leucine-rich repeat protein [Operophtera brumata]